jgi:DNA-binding MarR family transcriptional regulator
MPNLIADLKPEPNTLARQLLEIIPLVMRTIAAELRRTGLILSPSQFAVLVMLQHRPHRLGELAEHQAVSLPTMSGIVSGLVERGWVRRTRSPEDRRVLIVDLTLAGHEKLGHIGEQSAARLATLLASASEADRRELAAGLAVLRALFAADAGGQAHHMLASPDH